MVTLNGARRGKADHATVPITPAEIGKHANACFAAGKQTGNLYVGVEARLIDTCNHPIPIMRPLSPHFVIVSKGIPDEPYFPTSLPF